jgi:hypothetical protein
MVCQNYTGSMFDPHATDNTNKAIPSFDDPIMGKAPSCALIAALSSVAWVCWPKIKDTLAPAFFAVNADGNVSGNLASFSVAKYFDAGNAHSSDNGIWPSIYEKAYIVDLNNNAKGDAYYCDVSKSEFNSQWPQKTAGLVALTGWAKLQTDPVSMDAYNTISVKCEGTNMRTKMPAVAWTKTATDPIWVGKPYGYDQMIPDHCYSLLGCMLNGGQKYIVLRNPRYRSENASNGHLVPDGTIFYPKPASGLMDCYKQNYQIDSISLRKITGDIKLNLSTGLFAIHNDQFKQYFMGYGWVK